MVLVRVSVVMVSVHIGGVLPPEWTIDGVATIARKGAGRWSPTAAGAVVPWLGARGKSSATGASLPRAPGAVGRPSRVVRVWRSRERARVAGRSGPAGGWSRRRRKPRQWRRDGREPIGGLRSGRRSRSDASTSFSGCLRTGRTSGCKQPFGRASPMIGRLADDGVFSLFGWFCQGKSR